MESEGIIISTAVGVVGLYVLIQLVRALVG
jgi:hypothetical protein